jgi:hypothetical protein
VSEVCDIGKATPEGRGDEAIGKGIVIIVECGSVDPLHLFLRGNTMADLRSTLDKFLADANNRWGSIVLLAVAEFLLLVGIALVLFLRAQGVSAELLSGFLPAAPSPTPACVQTTLILGLSSFPVQALSAAQESAFSLPAAQGDQAYQVSGAPAGYLFGLNPSTTALALEQTLHSGSAMRIVLPNCAVEDFVVQAVAAGAPDPTALRAQANDSLRVFVPATQRFPGLTIQGVRPEALSVPTPACSMPFLGIGSTVYPISEVTPAADGTWDYPLKPAVAAYHLKGTHTYVLPPAPENLALGSTLRAGDLVSLLIHGCIAADYQLAAPRPGAELEPTNPAALIIFIEGPTPEQGFLIEGEPVAAAKTATATVTPDPNAGQGTIQAAASLLEVTSPDANTLRVRIALKNTGASAITLYPNDIQLLPVEAGPFVPTTSDPQLPFSIAPGITQAFSLTFPRPAAPGTVIRIFAAEFTLQGY